MAASRPCHGQQRASRFRLRTIGRRGYWDFPTTGANVWVAPDGPADAPSKTDVALQLGVHRDVRARGSIGSRGSGPLCERDLRDRFKSAPVHVLEQDTGTGSSGEAGAFGGRAPAGR